LEEDEWQGDDGVEYWWKEGEDEQQEEEGGWKLHAKKMVMVNKQEGRADVMSLKGGSAGQY